MLYIKQGPAAVISKVEEVANSDIESKSSIDSNGKEVTVGVPY
jgi:hypothetical protein